MCLCVGSSEILFDWIFDFICIFAFAMRMTVLTGKQTKQKKTLSDPCSCASLKPTLHDQSLDGDTTVCGFP